MTHKIKLDPETKKALLSPGLMLIGGVTSGETDPIKCVVNYLHAKGLRSIQIADPENKYGFKKAGVEEQTFKKKDHASTVRAALRMNPQALVVGEIQNYEILDIALMAADIGHIVIGTLHARTPKIIKERLLDMQPIPRSVITKEILDINLRIITQARNETGEIELKTNKFSPKPSFWAQRLIEALSV